MTLSSARRTRCARLRRLLADQRWHRWDELQEVAGRRYGARIYDIRHGVDGGEKLKVIGKSVNHYDWFWKVSSGLTRERLTEAARLGAQYDDNFLAARPRPEESAE